MMNRHDGREVQAHLTRSLFDPSLCLWVDLTMSLVLFTVFFSSLPRLGIRTSVHRRNLV